MFMAYFQEDGALRYSITPQPVKTRERADFEIERFVARMSHPKVGKWWCYVEQVREPDVSD